MAVRSSRSLTAAPMPAAVYLPAARRRRRAFLRTADRLVCDGAAFLVSLALALAILAAVVAAVGGLS